MIEAFVLAASVPEWTARSEGGERQDIVVTGERVSRNIHETAFRVEPEALADTQLSLAYSDRIGSRD